jgi:hypothetical protein
MKLTNQKKLYKIVKGTLAMILAGSFTFSATNAFAAGTTDQTNNYQTVDLQSETTADANGTTQTTETQEAPSLLPGDFFYFAKTAFEKIQLALSFDKVKDAQLLAEFASERLAEAQALFSSGNQDEAVKTIEAALEYMKNADQMVDQPKDENQATDEVSTDDQATDNQATDEVSTDDQATDDQAADEVSSDDQATDEQSDSQDVENVKEVLSQNIIALQAALEKVKNPVAKAALQRNIDKSYAKLAKKIDKIESKFEKNKAHKKHKEHSDADQAATDQDQNTATQDDSSTTTEPTTTEDVKAETEKAAPVTTTTEKATHQAVKKEVKATWNAVKQERKEAHQEFKTQKHEAVKKFVQEMKEERSHNEKEHK